MRGSRTVRLTTAALLAALLAASAWIAIPIGAVPVTLQVFVVVLAALVLAPRWAAAAVFVYLLVGAVGAPVFSGARGGLAVLVGPTGGYLFGFLGGAWLGAVVRRGLTRRSGRTLADGLGALTVVAVVYLVGTVQLAAVTGMDAAEAIAVGAVPFILPDLVKGAVAIGAAAALRRAGVADA